MLIAAWIVTFILIIAVGIYAGTKIAHANQWSGSDRSSSAFAVGAMLGAWQIGGMSVVGAAQNGYTMGIAGCWYSIASGVYILFLGLLAGPLRKNLKTEALRIIWNPALAGRCKTSVLRMDYFRNHLYSDPVKDDSHRSSRSFFRD